MYATVSYDGPIAGFVFILSFAQLIIYVLLKQMVMFAGNDNLQDNLQRSYKTAVR